MQAWFESLTGLSLQAPGALLVTLLVPLALWRRRRLGAPAVPFAPAAFALAREPFSPAGAPLAARAPLPVSWRLRLSFLPPSLHVLGIVAAVVALARPVERTRLPLAAEGIDIVLGLDVSSSMAAGDLDAQRSRLDVAKAAAASFVAARPGDRIGLVTFARYPDLRCPPTLDHDALLAILAEVAMVGSDSQEDATGIGAALAKAAQVLQRSPGTSRVFLLLTDGEETVATGQVPNEIAPLHAAQLCRQLGVRIYAIAAGSGEGSAGGTAKAIDTTALADAARLSGGRFFAARDRAALGEVYAEIDALERQALAQPRYRVDERCAPFLGSALALMVLAWLLRRTLFATLP